jgi:hypothetical protein
MGWTGGYTQADGGVRAVVIQAYEGDPLACGNCGYRESQHPRVTGSEYDAIYGPSKDPRPAPHDFVVREQRYRVLDYAQVGWSAVYMAIETIATGEVWAGVCLVNRGRYDFAIKELTETMGPAEDRCPIRVLDRLTPTDDKWASEWRARCRAYHARRASLPKLRKGDRVRFAEPMAFSNGDTLAELIFETGSTFRGPEGYGRYHVTSWRDRAFEVVRPTGLLA